MDILTGKKRGNRPFKVRVKTKYQTLKLDIDIQSKKRHIKTPRRSG